MKGNCLFFIFIIMIIFGCIFVKKEDEIKEAFGGFREGHYPVEFVKTPQITAQQKRKAPCHAKGTCGSYIDNGAGGGMHGYYRIQKDHDHIWTAESAKIHRQDKIKEAFGGFKEGFREGACVAGQEGTRVPLGPWKPYARVSRPTRANGYSRMGGAVHPGKQPCSSGHFWNKGNSHSSVGAGPGRCTFAECPAGYKLKPGDGGGPNYSQYWRIPNGGGQGFSSTHAPKACMCLNPPPLVCGAGYIKSGVRCDPMVYCDSYNCPTGYSNVKGTNCANNSCSQSQCCQKTPKEVIPHCVSQLDWGKNCVKCDPEGYKLNAAKDKCDLIPMVEISNCAKQKKWGKHCIICNNGYKEASNNEKCDLIPIPFCKKQDKEVCLECNDGYESQDPPPKVEQGSGEFYLAKDSTLGICPPEDEINDIEECRTASMKFGGTGAEADGTPLNRARAARSSPAWQRGCAQQQQVEGGKNIATYFMTGPNYSNPNTADPAAKSMEGYYRHSYYTGDDKGKYTGKYTGKPYWALMRGVCKKSAPKNSGKTCDPISKKKYLFVQNNEI